MKRLLYPIACIIMLLCAITAEAQLPLNVISQREYDNKPADNSLFAQRENQQRQMIRASREGGIQMPRFNIPSRQRKMPFATSAGSVFRGTLLANFEWPDYSPQYGIYEVTSASPDLNTIYLDSEGIMYAEYGSAIIGDNYYLAIGYDYGIYGTIYVVYKFNLAKMEWDGDASRLIPNQDLKYLAYTNTPYDEETKRSYGFYYTSDGKSLEFCKMNYATLVRTKISNANRIYTVLSIDDTDGQLYGIDSQGDLYKIDKSNGNETLVGNTGLTPSTYHQAAAIDSSQGKLYWAFVEPDLTTGMAEVDLHTAEAIKCYEFDNVVQFGDLYLTASGVDDNSPSMVENLSWTYNSSNPNHIDLTFTMPMLTNNGTQVLGDDLSYVVRWNDDVVATGPASAGEQKTITVEGLPTGQLLHLGVLAANTSGEGGASYVDAWAGYDSPEAPPSATLQIDASGTVSLTWTPSTKGQHGGYVVPENIRYHVYAEPSGELVTTTANTTYTTQFSPDGLTSLYYSVEAFTDDYPTPSGKTFSNRAALGEYITPAYEVTFDDMNAIESYWTIVDANNDGETWYFERTYHNMRIGMGNNGNNDWMLSPPLYLEKDKLYDVEFDASTAYGGKMRMAYGPMSETDPKRYTELIGTTAIAPDDPTTYSTKFSVAESGVYRIGLQETATVGIYTELYRFRIGDAMDLAAPQAPTGLTATAAPQGGMGATVTFTTPTKAINGEMLTQLDYVVIARDGNVIGTIDSNIAPGTTCSFTDESVTVNGMATYTVRAANEAGLGETATTSVFIGLDQPESPLYAQLVDNGNGTVTISWENSPVGRHGGYVDVSQVKNSVYTVENNKIADKLSTLTGTSYTTAVDLGGAPAWFYLAVTAQGNDDSESDATLGHMIKGDPVGIPLEESFAEQKIHGSQFWWATPLEGDTNWGLSGNSADGDGGSMMFITQAANDKAVVGTRKISLKGNNNPKLFFKYYSSHNSTATLTVQVDRAQQGTIDDVAVYDMATINPDGNWLQASVDLAGYTGDDYVIIRFLATATKARTSVGFDDFILLNDVGDDIAVTTEAPSTFLAGQQADINVTVSNLGESLIGDYSVKLTLLRGSTETLLGEASGSQIKLGEHNEHHFTFRPDITMTGEALLTAEVIYDTDQNPDNNKTTEDIIIGNYPTTAISDLTGSGDGQYVNLNWTNPQGEVKALQTITDDFEGYTPWLTDFAPWTNHDGDGGLAGGLFSSINYPGQGTAFSFIIFKPNALVADATSQVPSLTPLSGSQYAATIYSVNPDNNQVLDQDNWLISPLLPGIPQTVTLYAKTMNEYYPNAQVEVLYSTTGNAPADFTKLGDTHRLSSTDEWTRITVTLPMGTTYFAIRDITSETDAFMLMADDVTFTQLGEDAMEVTGYNVYVDNSLFTTIDGKRSGYLLGPLSDGEHHIQLTLLYGDEKLESALSNTASATTDIPTIAVSDIENNDVTVYTLSGAIIAQGKNATRHLPQGVYIVKSQAGFGRLNIEK